MELNLSETLENLSKIDGVEVKVYSEQDVFFKNTLGASRKVYGEIFISQREAIPEILKIAHQFQFSIYTVSTGHNWGYGGHLPVVNNCFILNLSRLNRIIEFDEDLGVVTLEPGVTQAQLSVFLKSKSSTYMVPTTGAGPDASILGNAMEKGYGITPIEDHFLAVTSIKGYLPNGKFYQSLLADFGGSKADRVFKWKIGPYIEGMFVQSNLIVATEATVLLAKKPDQVMQFVSFVNDQDLEKAVTGIHKIRQTLPGIVGGVNLMNRRRMLSMLEDHSEWLKAPVLSESLINELGKKKQISDWIILGGIYSPDSIHPGVKKVIKKSLKGFSKRTVFIGSRHLKVLNWIVKIFPIKSLKKTADGLNEALRVLSGEPTRVALPLAYLKNKSSYLAAKFKDPDKDECGLIWFAPLMPIKGSLVRDYVSRVKEICVRNEIEPLITLTAISERCFDSTIPIVFNSKNESSKANAQKCYKDLISMAKQLGIFPYRLDIEAMESIGNLENSEALKIISAVKKTLDPQNILSPGRYNLPKM